MHYKEKLRITSINSAYDPFYQPPSKLILSVNGLFDYIVKAMKFYYSMPETGNYLFAKNFRMTKRYNPNLFHKSDYSAAFFLNCNSNIDAVKLGFVIKKKHNRQKLFQSIQLIYALLKKNLLLAFFDLFHAP